MSNTRRSQNPAIAAVDLFCGIGGLTHGLVRGGIAVSAGIDVDPECRFAFEANNRATFIDCDVGGLSCEELEKLYPKNTLKLLAGCAPCQPFSTYSRSGRGKRHESQWPLVKEFGRLAKELQPELITMENVPQLLDHKVFREFVGALSGYKMWWSVVECSSFGVPQTRKRMVFLASRLGDKKLELRPSTKRKGATVREAIGRLPPIAAGEGHADDPLHMASSLSSLNLKRIRASLPGGTWRDWPPSLQAACHRKSSGATYPSVYGRMAWDEAAPTITTQCFGYGNGRFGHPDQDRAISLREAAILQTFPRRYRFVGDDSKIKFNKLGRFIGNAVPVRLGEEIGRTLIAHAREYAPSK